jgi:hypothetical protein
LIYVGSLDSFQHLADVRDNERHKRHHRPPRKHDLRGRVGERFA